MEHLRFVERQVEGLPRLNRRLRRHHGNALLLLLALLRIAFGRRQGCKRKGDTAKKNFPKHQTYSFHKRRFVLRLKLPAKSLDAPCPAYGPAAAEAAARSIRPSARRPRSNPCHATFPPSAAL